MNQEIICILSAVLGACLGSYAALVIRRMPAGVSTISPRSRCDVCEKPLRFWQNVPIISWIFLRGRCFFCRAPIGFRSLFIEVFFAIALVAIVMKYGVSVLAAEKTFFVLLLVCLAYIDMDTLFLPNILIFFLVVLAVLSSVFFYFYPNGYVALSHHEPFLNLLVFPSPQVFSLTERLLGGLFGFLSLFSINLAATALLRKTGRLAPNQWAMGFGDPLLLMAIGLFVGLSHLVLTIFLASFLGSVFGILHKLSTSKPVQSAEDVAEGALPFGPFLSLAAIYVYLF